MLPAPANATSKLREPSAVSPMTDAGENKVKRTMDAG